MYQVWVWDEDALEFIPERLDPLTGSRADYDSWQAAADAATARRLADGKMRKVEYRAVRTRKRRP